MRLRRDHPAARPGPGGQPHLVVLDVIAADVADRGQRHSLGDHPAGELPQRVLRSLNTGRGQERAQPLPLDRRLHLRRHDPDLRPLRGGDAPSHRPASGRHTYRQRAHRAAISCAASISPTAATSASMRAAARRCAAHGRSHAPDQPGGGAPSRISSSPSADSGRPRRGPFSTIARSRCARSTPTSRSASKPRGTTPLRITAPARPDRSASD